MPSYAFPPPPESVPPTPIEDCDALVARLHSQRQAFAELDLAARIAMLEQVVPRLLEVAPAWVDAALQAKGLDPTRSESGEEWLAGPMITIRNVRMLIEVLRQVQAKGGPVLPDKRISQRNDGRTVVQVFPNDFYDSVLFSGFSAEVWMEPGVSPANVRDTTAVIYKGQAPAGRVALVLGAGNVASIPPMDAIYKMFAENQVVLVKMNPVNAYLGAFFEQAFAPWIARGFFGVVYGGAEVGAHLCEHPQVDTLHITGSDATHDAIVWGPAEGREARKQAGEPVNTKPISSELGNVTPVIVVPGPWTESELQFQAENVATMVANNASFNCNAAKLLVTAEGWELRDAFLAKLREVLAAVPNRKAYYPGAAERHAQFLAAHADGAEVLSPEVDGTVPWTLIPNLDASAEDEICFTREPFCGVLHEVALPFNNAIDFLPAAVDFVNDRVWGSLACMVLIHPRTRRDPAAEAAFQECLDELRYGGIAINHWAGVNYGLCATTWGAHPGHPLSDIQSGREVVHNTFLFSKPQKSVMYGPFTMFPKPPWFVTHTRTREMGELLTRFEAAPSVFKLPGIIFNAIRGG